MACLTAKYIYQIMFSCETHLQKSDLSQILILAKIFNVGMSNIFHKIKLITEYYPYPNLFLVTVYVFE